MCFACTNLDCFDCKLRQGIKRVHEHRAYQLENTQDHSPKVPEALCIGTSTSLVAMTALFRTFPLCKDWEPKDLINTSLYQIYEHRYNVT